MRVVYIVLELLQVSVLSVAVPSAADMGMLSVPSPSGRTNERSADTCAVVADVPAGPYATTAGCITSSVRLDEVTGRLSADDTLMALDPLVSSAAVVSIWRTSRLVDRAP